MTFDTSAAIANLAAVLRTWPIGTIVWHRGSGERGVIDGVKVCADALAIPSVSFGGRVDTCYACELSRTPIPDDNETWKSTDPNP